jgi:hypothetical protein
LPVEVVQVVEGESGLANFNLTDERLNAFSTWWALPSAMKDGDIPKTELGLAKHFGVTQKWLREVKNRPEVVDQVRTKLHSAAVYGMPDILFKQMKVAEEGDTKAARFVAEISQVIKQGGINVNNNVITPTIYEQASDDQLMEQARRIIGRRVDPEESDTA